MTAHSKPGSHAFQGVVDHLTSKAEKYLQLPEDALDEAVLDTYGGTASGQVNSSGAEFSDAHDEAERQASEVNNGAAILEVGDVYPNGNFCPSAPALLVTMPGDTASRTVTTKISDCGNAAIDPVLSGTTGSG